MATTCRKAKYGYATTALSALVLWLLVSFVPVFHNGVPAQVSNAIPVAVSAALGAVVAYRTKHEKPIKRAK